jgi:hypothetical protein
MKRTIAVVAASATLIGLVVWGATEKRSISPWPVVHAVVILPEGVRGQLQKWRGLGRFAGGPVTPQ